jgi:hypothetical protein
MLTRLLFALFLASAALTVTGCDDGPTVTDKDMSVPIDMARQDSNPGN